MESAAKQFVKRRNDPTYIDGRSETARNLIKRLAKRKKKMSEETILEAKVTPAVVITQSRRISSSQSVRSLRRKNAMSVTETASLNPDYRSC